MKRLIVCNDGTWNNPEQEDNGIPAPTNVFKIHNAIADKDGETEQLRYYHPGVGGEGGILDLKRTRFHGSLDAGKEGLLRLSGAEF